LGKGFLLNQGVASVSDSLKKFNDERAIQEYVRFCDFLSFDEEDFLFEILLEKMKKTHSSKEIIKSFNSVISKDSFLVPVSVFSGVYSPYESLVYFLVNVQNMRLKDIAKLLGKSESSVWTTLNNAKKRNSELNLDSSILFPLDNYDTKKSVLENVVLFLVENLNYKIKEVSEILNKSVSTIWSTYNKVKQK